GYQELDRARQHHPHPDVPQKAELEALDRRRFAEVERRFEIVSLEAEPLAVAEVLRALLRVGEGELASGGVFVREGIGVRGRLSGGEPDVVRLGEGAREQFAVAGGDRLDGRRLV